MAGRGTSVIRGEAESSGTARPGGEEAQMDLINVHKGLMGGCEEDRAGLSSLVLSDRTRARGDKLKYEKFYLNAGKNFFKCD